MKYITALLFAMAILLAPAAVAQEYATDQGSWLIGGSASITSQRTDFGNDNDRTTSIFISPTAQYFVRPGLAVGGSLSFSYLTNDSFSSRAVGVGPAVSYYLGGPERRVLPFVAAQIQVFRSSNRSEIVDIEGDLPGTRIESTATSFSFDASAGGVLMIAKNIGLTGEVFYTVFESNFDEFETSSNAFGLRAGIAAFVF